MRAGRCRDDHSGGPLIALGRTPRRVPPVRYAVPAYFHPAVEPAGWRGLAALGPALAFAILNPDSGPAAAIDPRYQDPIAAVHAAGGRVIGYVDTAYGHRPIADVLDDLTAYQSWYRLGGVFLDQVAARAEWLDHYRRIVAAARRGGVDYVVLNPGVVPAPGYLDIADVVVTFEGTWAAYRERRPAEHDDAEMRRHPSGRFCHLVHDAPEGTLATVVDAAARHNVGVVYTTQLTGANPWAALSADLSAPPPDLLAPPPHLSAPRPTAPASPPDSSTRRPGCVGPPSGLTALPPDLSAPR